MLDKMHGNVVKMPASFAPVSAASEQAIYDFICDFKAHTWNDDQLFHKIEELLRKCVSELGETSDVIYNYPLAKTVIVTIGFEEIRTTNSKEYAVRKYIRSVMNMYVQTVAKSRPIYVREHTRFGLQMKKYGITIGFTVESTSRSIFPDGNVIILTVALFTIVTMIVLKMNSK